MADKAIPDISLGGAEQNMSREELAAVAKKHNITKTALVLVGDVISNQHYTRSRLYAPDFTTEFRKAKTQNTVENEGVMCNIHAGKELPE